MLTMPDKADWFGRVSRHWERVERHGLAWMTVPALTQCGVLHGVTTRHGGTSEASGLRSLNLGWNRPDPRENVEANYRRLADAAGFFLDSMALVNYEHGDGIARAYAGDGGKGWKAGAFPPCDALVTDCPDVTLFTLHADCMPVFLFDPTRRAGAMIHAGWKGTSKRIGAKAVARLQAEFDSLPENIVAAIGPSIAQKRFEVDRPVYEIFRDAFAIENAAGSEGQAIALEDEARGKFHIDLWAIMAFQLMEAGIRPEKLTLPAACTYDNADDFFSYRRDGKVCGAMAGFLRV